MAILTIGNETLGSSWVQFPPANNKAVCRFQNTYSYPIAVSKFFGFWDSTPGAKVKAVIYSDSSGAPASLLGASDEKVGLAGGWNLLTFSTPITIVAGAYVWIGVISDTSCGTHGCVSGGTILYNADTYSDGAAATFGSSSSAPYTYPMWVEGDDGQHRLGRASVNAGSGTYQADREHGDKFTLGGTASISVQSISTYVKTTSATVKCKAAIFSDSGGAPGTKIAQTEEVTGTTANTWLTLNFASPPTLSPGTYWLCFIASADINCPTIPVGGYLRVDGTDTEASAWSSPSTLLMDIAPNGIDIFATYDVAVASAARPVVMCVT